MLTLTPIGGSSDGERSLERYRRAVLTSIAILIIKLLNVVIVMASVPLTLHYLGEERYGIWMTVSSWAAVFSLADLGLANGLLNAVARASGPRRDEAVRHSVSSAFAILAIIAVGLAAGFVLLRPFIPWAWVFNVPAAVADEAAHAVFAFVVCFAVGLPLGVSTQVQIGLQRGFAAAVFQGIASCLTLCFLVVAIQARASLPQLVFAISLAPLVAAAASHAYFFSACRPDLKPRLGLLSVAGIREISSEAALFFLLQVTILLLTSVDNIIVAQAMGPVAVAHLAVPTKMFSFIGTLTMVLLQPLWPAYGDAIAHGDMGWVRRALARATTAVLCVTAVLAITMVAWGDRLMSLWIGTPVEASLPLLAGLGTWSLLNSLGTSISMVLNALRVIGLQVRCAVITGGLAVVGKLLLVGPYGPEGVVWSTCGAYIVGSAIPIMLCLPALLRTAPQPSSRHGSP